MHKGCEVKKWSKIINERRFIFVIDINSCSFLTYHIIFARLRCCYYLSFRIFNLCVNFKNIWFYLKLQVIGKQIVVLDVTLQVTFASWYLPDVNISGPDVNKIFRTFCFDYLLEKMIHSNQSLYFDMIYIFLCYIYFYFL